MQTEIGRVRVKYVRTKRDVIHGFRDYLVEKFSATIFIDFIQCSSEYVVVKVFREHAVPQQSSCREIFEILGVKIQSAFVKPQTIQAHSFNHGRVRYVVIPIFWYGGIYRISNIKFVECSSNKSKVCK